MADVAVVLAAGRGTRMKSDIAKQYILMGGRPVLAYSLRVFEESFIDEVVLVTGEGDEDYCQSEIVEKYGFSKVRHIVPGGKERQDSVLRGLECMKESVQGLGEGDFAYIHDGARPFISREILVRGREAVRRHGACVIGMPVKDTIKIADGGGFVKDTPDRSLIWQVQTPQIFSFPLILDAYEKLAASPGALVTDDAMAAERMLGTRAALIEGSYENIKITTPDDLALGEAICGRYWEE